MHFPRYIEMSAAAQTQYANLAQAARLQELQRSIADLPGGFVSKVLKGRTYWYYQFKLPDKIPQQFYIGPDDELTRELIEAHKNPSIKQAHKHLASLCEAAQSMGCYSVIPKHARVLHRLASHGLFHAGAVLVGTHAYLAYQNRLGVIWGSGHTTVDLDFAHPGKNLSVAVSDQLKIDTHSAIESLKMGFVPVNDGTRYVKSDETDFDLDFLTCLHRGGDAPLDSKQLNVKMQPLRFLEYSLEDPVVNVLLSSSGPIVVNLPRPERYALGKLLLYPIRRDGQHPEKAPKDIQQAASLIEYFSSNDPDTLLDAWEDLISRGPSWRKLAMQGLQALGRHHPDLAQALDVPNPQDSTPGMAPTG